MIRHCLPALLVCAAVTAGAGPAKARRKPLMRDFMGLNAHFKFRPELYRPVCRLLRNYHNIGWDYGQRPIHKPPAFPLAANKVDWNKHVYGQWKAAGYQTHASIQFGAADGKRWAAAPESTYAYGKAFAAYFGPSGAHRLLTAAEIGNEPSKIDDETYRKIFRALARGLRDGDPKLKILTATAAVKPTKWAKALALFEDLGALYDVVNVHKYAAAEGWPTWRRSFPEDPRIDFLDTIRAAVDWRDEHAPDKEVWLTEFGYDACTDAALQTRQKPFTRWTDVTDRQQAQWLVRSFVVLAAMDIARAYLYFYNDDDQARVHAAAGLTRGFEPKPSFHAVAHLYRTLGDYRFRRVVRREAGAVFVFEFVHARAARAVWVVWSPTGRGRRASVTLSRVPGRAVKAERMPLAAGDPPTVAGKRVGARSYRMRIGESPTYVWFDTGAD